MKYLSVCSGIEAATVAWHPLGWEPVAFSEIEPFPSAVLAHHYPQVPNLGDMTKHKEWNLGTIDLLVGGTPCQSFSVAGLRKGLDDPRGNLMLTYLAIADRNRPTWLVWENVPGVLSSNGGKDFGTFLGGLGELGYGFAYRVLDAQYFGVAQRRRRVFVVGYLGDWRPAAAVLFERESVCGNPAPSREAGKKVAGTIAASSFSGGASGRPEGAAGERRGVTFGIPGNWIGRQPENGGNSTQFMEEVAPCLTIADKHGVAHTVGSLCARTGQSISVQDAQQGHLMMAQPINIYGGNKRSDRPEGGFYVRMDEDTSKTLDAATGLNPTCSQGGTAVMQPMAFTQNTRDEVRWINGDGQIAGALAAETGMKQTNYVAQPMVIHGTQDPCTSDIAFAQGRNSGGENVLVQPTVFGMDGDIMNDVMETLTTREGSITDTAHAVNHPLMQVRRLTPVECERLQGFPDGYTNIPWRKADQSPDGPRYKVLGNSMAVPVMAWIGKRIAEYEQQAVSG